MEVKKKEIIEKLKNREKKLFNTTVELLMAGEIERAIIYANECAFVRRLIKFLED